MTYLLIVISFYGQAVTIHETRTAQECYNQAAIYLSLETMVFDVYCVPIISKEAARELRK